MNIDEILKHKRDEILKIAHRYGAKNIRLFGSIVRGEIKEKSDVDFLIGLESGRSLLDIIAMRQDLEDLLDCKVDVITEAALNPYIKDEVLSQVVSL